MINFNNYNMKNFQNKSKLLSKQGIKSVMNPTAQTVELCMPVNHSTFSHGEVMKCVLSKFNSNTVEAAIMEVMILSGSRIQQTLDIRPMDVLPTGVIIIHAAKGGSAIRSVPILTREFWLSYARKYECINTIYNRFYFYRLFKQLGFYYVDSKGVRNSVTHSFRVSAIRETKNMDITETERAKMFGHNNNNSQQYYLNNGKKRV